MWRPVRFQSGSHPRPLPGSRSPRSRPAAGLTQRRLACGSSPLHRFLRRRPLPGALAHTLRADPTRVDSCSVLVVLHHLDGLLRRWAPGLLHPGADHGVRRVDGRGSACALLLLVLRGVSPFEGLLLADSRTTSRWPAALLAFQRPPFPAGLGNRRSVFGHSASARLLPPPSPSGRRPAPPTTSRCWMPPQHLTSLASPSDTHRG